MTTRGTYDESSVISLCEPHGVAIDNCNLQCGRSGISIMIELGGSSMVGVVLKRSKFRFSLAKQVQIRINKQRVEDHGEYTTHGS